jgi:hypothetical protein
MKLKKHTSTLLALGILSAAGVASAANPVVYLTGSTAARSQVESALKTAGVVFTGAGVLVGGVAGSADFVYEGTLVGTSTTVDVNCHWSGSEAGIAAVAGQILQQNVNGGTYNLPGVPPSFLTQSSGWTASDTLANIVGPGAVPDLAMADTSQAVSFTPSSSHPLDDLGMVGIIPFSFVKCYDSNPSATWNHIVNITTAMGNQLLGGPQNGQYLTGVATDQDAVVMVGRNYGSGTRANCLINLQYPVATTVDQFAWGGSYNGGDLVFSGTYGSGQTLFESLNDGFDSGGNVAKVLQVDGASANSGAVVIGYLGVSDAFAAITGSNATGHNATCLPFNGVYESDDGVINGSYSYWGQEHIFAPHSHDVNSNGGKVGSKLVTYFTGTGSTAFPQTWVKQSADLRTVKQSTLIPKSKMLVKRGSDGGFPVQGGF